MSMSVHLLWKTNPSYIQCRPPCTAHKSKGLLSLKCTAHQKKMCNICGCTLVYLEEMIPKLELYIFIKVLIMASSVLNTVLWSQLLSESLSKVLKSLPSSTQVLFSWPFIHIHHLINIQWDLRVLSTGDENPRM